jgi:hypothetical protein
MLVQVQHQQIHQQLVDKVHRQLQHFLQEQSLHMVVVEEEQ